jgi:hypothetical protein
MPSSARPRAKPAAFNWPEEMKEMAQLEMQIDKGDRKRSLELWIVIICAILAGSLWTSAALGQS